MSYALPSLEVGPVSRMLKALGDETRLRIVALLAHGELCVCHVEQALSLSQPNASRQLAILKAAGVVAHRRSGSWIHYRLAEQPDAQRRALLRALLGGFKHRAILRRDVERLLEAKGPGSCK
jgi:ArsR family transcriptional regulator, arsenate/arsenite/antimonite-responsive transcriptional repressor